MRTPDPAELRRLAQFKVGDEVWTRASGPWRVTARYWSRAQGCIAYDLEYPYNGVILSKVPELEVFATRQHNGTRQSMG
jgi:hypothetical protein